MHNSNVEKCRFIRQKKALVFAMVMKRFKYVLYNIAVSTN